MTASNCIACAGHGPPKCRECAWPHCGLHDADALGSASRKTACAGRRRIAGCTIAALSPCELHEQAPYDAFGARASSRACYKPG